MSRVLIVAGLVLLAAGVALRLGVPLGRLPGDLVIEREHTTIYIPIATSIVASVVLTLIMYLARR